jgi:hypothetical protein
MPDYWIAPNAVSVQLEFNQSHSDKARDILGFSPEMPEEHLMQRGWIRVVACFVSGNLFFERRAVPTEKQFGALKSLAIELGVKLDDGKRIVYDPSQEVF